jgi:hypothetical protein
MPRSIFSNENNVFKELVAAQYEINTVFTSEIGNKVTYDSKFGDAEFFQPYY